MVMSILYRAYMDRELYATLKYLRLGANDIDAPSCGNCSGTWQE